MARFFITGGGTGGHIYPAIAVADALSDDEVFYVGNPKNLEFDIVSPKGYKFFGSECSRYAKKNWLQLV